MNINLEKIVLYIYPEKILLMVANQQHQSVFICDAIFFFHIIFHIFFHTHLAFVFHLQKNFYVVHTHSSCSFSFTLLQKDLDTFHVLFLKPFFIIFSWWIFRNFYTWEKILYKKLVLKNGLRFCVININILCSLHDSEDYELMKNHLKSLKLLQL